MPEATKRCPVCGLIKALSEFPPRRDRSSGVMSRCHGWDAAKQRRRYWFGGGQARRRAYDQERAERRRAAG